MPHFQIDYSANLDAVVDMSALCEVVRAAASEVEAFPTPGIRVRATRVDFYAMADGDPKHGFIDMSVRLREGRSFETKKDAIKRVFAALKEFLKPALQSQSIAISAEMRDIDAALSPKFGNVREHLEGSS